MGFQKRLAFYLCVLSLTLLWSVLSGDRITPDYKGVDPEGQPYIDEFKDVAKKHGLTFKHQVTMGFTDIKFNFVVGICHYGMGFREIDVDRNYWNICSPLEKKVLLFHELVHCYCTRLHDYGKNLDYDENDYTKGYGKDGCPISIMAPNLPTQECIKKHYEWYMLEMWDRCNPY